MIYVVDHDDEISDNQINHSSDLFQSSGKVIHV
jgi:hypothetical protein